MSPEAEDKLYFDFASRVAEESSAIRLKVGAVIVKDHNILSYGWNGTAPGEDNTCEYVEATGNLITKWEVRHAEWNAIAKLLRHGTLGITGATMYITHSPCKECSKLIEGTGINRVVYGQVYRDADGLAYLDRRGIFTQLLNYEGDSNANSETNRTVQPC